MDYGTAIFTGARVEELAQLNIHTDIAEDAESGYWFIHLRGASGGSVKTLAGWRKVPLHPALGFPRRRPACSEAVFETYLAAIQIAAPGRLNLLRAVPTVSYSVTSRAVAGNPMRRVPPIMSAAASAGSAYRLDHNMMILRVNTLNKVTAVGGIERPAAARHIMALDLLVGCSDRGA